MNIIMRITNLTDSLCLLPRHIIFFFLMNRPPPSSTLFPYTTLFRSGVRPRVCRPDGSGGESDAGGPGRITLSATSIRSEEHTSELQSQSNLVCRLLLEKKKQAGEYDPPRDRGIRASRVCARQGTVVH